MNELGFRYLTEEQLVGLAKKLFDDPPPIRDFGLLGAAAARPQTSAFGEDAYPDIWTKAAALLHSIVKNHPLIDGNKRLGWFATAFFLGANQVEKIDGTTDEAYDLVIRVATTEISVDEIAEELSQIFEQSTD